MAESSGERFELNRRKVLQGAAWAAPAIIIATAAPAAASSVPDYSFIFDVNGSGATYGEDSIWGFLQIVNVSGEGGPTIEGPIVVSVTFSNPDALDTSNPVLLTPDGSGWSVMSSGSTVTFTYPDDLPPSSGSTTINYEIPLSDTAAALGGLVSVNASATVDGTFVEKSADFDLGSL